MSSYSPPTRLNKSQTSSALAFIITLNLSFEKCSSQSSANIEFYVIITSFMFPVFKLLNDYVGEVV